MDSQGLFKGTFPIIEKALDLRALKHSVTVANIANRDTPNYKAFNMIVEDELQRAMGGAKKLELQRSHKDHLPASGTTDGAVKLQTEEPSQISLRRDGNTVDIDREMAKLAENQLMYDALARIVSKKFNSLKNVIQGGK